MEGNDDIKKYDGFMRWMFIYIPLLMVIFVSYRHYVLINNQNNEIMMNISSLTNNFLEKCMIHDKDNHCYSFNQSISKECLDSIFDIMNVNGYTIYDVFT